MKNQWQFVVLMAVIVFCATLAFDTVIWARSHCVEHLAVKPAKEINEVCR